jgi:hypothetical protein
MVFNEPGLDQETSDVLSSKSHAHVSVLGRNAVWTWEAVCSSETSVPTYKSTSNKPTY